MTADRKPDHTSTYRDVEFAQWGQVTVPAGVPSDPVPGVYSSAGCIEVSELRMDFATTEALIERLQAAIAYERERGAK